MDGGEVETRRRDSAPLTYGKLVVLNEAERMDLVALASQPVYKTLCKLFDSAVVEARDEAMMVDPGEERRQLAMMSDARAIARFSDRVKRQIEFAIEEHRGALEAKAAREDINDRGRIEEIICNPLNLRPGFPERQT